MYPFNGGVNYFGNGTMQRQMTPQQPPGLLGMAQGNPMQGTMPPQAQGIPYNQFNSAPGSGMDQMLSIMRQFGQPSTFGGGAGMAGNPYGGNPLMQNGFGANPFSQASSNPYAQNGMGMMAQQQANVNPYQMINSMNAMGPGPTNPMAPIFGAAGR